MLLRSPFSSTADPVAVNMRECLFRGRHRSEDFRREWVHLNLTIPLEVPSQPRSPGKEAARWNDL